MKILRAQAFERNQLDVVPDKRGVFLVIECDDEEREQLLAQFREEPSPEVQKFCVDQRVKIVRMGEPGIVTNIGSPEQTRATWFEYYVVSENKGAWYRDYELAAVPDWCIGDSVVHMPFDSNVAVVDAVQLDKGELMLRVKLGAQTWAVWRASECRRIE